MEQGIWNKSNPKQLALEFYSPFYLLVSISDTTPDKKEAAIMDMYFILGKRCNAGLLSY